VLFCSVLVLERLVVDTVLLDCRTAFLFTSRFASHFQILRDSRLDVCCCVKLVDSSLTFFLVGLGVE
jgi:hypothetical protein